MRAAAFSYGVLAEFDRIQIHSRNSSARLIDHVDFLSGVSGGAITAAYFGLNGRAALANFQEKFLMRDAEESFSSIFNPMSVAHAYEGGINGSQQFPRWLDENLFHGATFGSLVPNTGHASGSTLRTYTIAHRSYSVTRPSVPSAVILRHTPLLMRLRHQPRCQ